MNFHTIYTHFKVKVFAINTFYTSLRVTYVTHKRTMDS